MYKAGLKAGFQAIEYTAQYPHPDFISNEVVRKYFDVCKGPDYVMKLRGNQ